MRPIIFRVAASNNIGMGHLMRCLALAQAAEDAQIPVLFLMDTQTSELAKARHDWHYAILNVPAKCSVNEESVWLAGVLSDHNAAALVVDGYLFDAAILNHIDRDTTCVVVIDDGQQTLTASADIVVNPASKELDSNYQMQNPGIICATGEAFRLLRREFRHTVPKPIAQRNGIAINFGGSDPLGLTLPLLQHIASLTQDIPVRVVTGAAFQGMDELTDWLKHTNLPVQHIHNCQDMADVWANARLAISAAGGSQFELGVCQTPSLIVVVADNQEAASHLAEQQGWCEVFDARTQDTIHTLAEDAVDMYGDTDSLQAMSDNAIGLYDADGCERLLTVIAGQVK